MGATLGSDKEDEWPERRLAAYSWGQIVGLYKEGDCDLINILCRKCNQEDLQYLIDVTCKNDQNKAKEMCSEFGKQYVPNNDSQPKPDENLHQWLSRYNRMYEDMLEAPDKGKALMLFFVERGFAEYSKKCYEKDFLESEKIKGQYGDVVTSNYNLIPINDNVLLMPISPPRIINQKEKKTTLIFMTEPFSKICDELQKKKMVGRLSVKGKGYATFTGKATKEILLEAVEKGSIFNFSIKSLPPITKLYSENYFDQLWVKVNNTDITFEELDDSKILQNNTIRTNMVHLQYVFEKGNYLITHLDHEYVFYSEDEYKCRVKDGGMATKGTGHKRVKTFKMDEAHIPFDYQCKMYMLKKDGTEYEEVMVPFMYFVLDTYFTHKKLLNEYFSKVL